MVAGEGSFFLLKTVGAVFTPTGLIFFFVLLMFLFLFAFFEMHYMLFLLSKPC
jgi:hypothetical protein